MLAGPERGWNTVGSETPWVGAGKRRTRTMWSKKCWR
jgi:hypothetical protein